MSKLGSRDVVRESATVVIVGAGPAGLTVANLLTRSEIDCVVLERRGQDYVTQRQRAGVVELRAARMFEEWGLADRVLGGPPAGDVLYEIRVDGTARLLGNEWDEHSGSAARLCPQQILVRNLIDAYVEDGGDLRFGSEVVRIENPDSDRPTVVYRDEAGDVHEIACAFVAGCDSDRGVSRTAIPDGVLTRHVHDYGVSWLTVLAEVPPCEHPMFAVSDDGWAAQFARGPAASRFYLQCAPEDRPSDWPDDRIWKELRSRLGDQDLAGGPIVDKEVFPLRAVVHEPMSHGRLFLVGDSAHLSSPAGAKGMNLALHDADVFARAVRDFVRDGDETGLRSYSDVCLARVWDYQEFSHMMTELMHEAGNAARGTFSRGLARARLNRLFTSEAERRAFSERVAGPRWPR